MKSHWNKKVLFGRSNKKAHKKIKELKKILKVISNEKK